MDSTPTTSQTKPLANQTGYTLQDEYFSRLYKATTQTSRKMLRDVLFVILASPRASSSSSSSSISSSSSSSSNSNSNSNSNSSSNSSSSDNLTIPVCLYDYFTQVLKCSNTNVKKTFNGDEIYLLKQPTNTAVMDVTLLCKIIQTIIEKFNDLHDLRCAVKNVKDMRNKVCHEYLFLDEKQLKDYMDELKSRYLKILYLIESVFTVNMDNEIQKYCREVDEISSMKIDISEYFQKMKELRLKLKSEFMAQSRQELEGYYSKLKVLNPFIWLARDYFPQMEVSKIFTPLRITDKGKVVSNENLLVESMKSVLMLSGIAGCGKTSLCRYLLDDWQTRGDTVTDLKHVDILFYIEARSVTSDSLIKFLQKSLLPETCLKYKDNNVEQILKGLSVLYVIDGMDEATEHAKTLIRDVFSIVSGSGGSRVIVTTRPEYESNVVQNSQQYLLTHMKLVIHGFSREGRQTYISRVFNAFIPDEEKCTQEEEEFLTYLNTTCKNFHDSLYIPLILALLICLWQENKELMKEITSSTNLYSKIYEIWTNKLVTRLTGKLTMHTMDLLDFVRSWLLALGKEALHMLRKDNFSIIVNKEARDQLCSLCQSKGIPSVEVLSAFLNCEESSNSSGVHHNFSFVHKSQIEYLASLYISNTLVTKYESNKDVNKIKSILESFGIFEWKNIWSYTRYFVIGQLNLLNVEEDLIKGVVDVILSIEGMTDNVTQLWRLVEESGRLKVVRDCMKNAVITNVDALVISNHGPSFGFHALIMLMQHTSFNPSVLHLVILYTPHHGDSIISEIAEFFYLLSQRSDPFKVDLFIVINDLRWGDQERSDSLMSVIPSNVRIEEFRGHLGPEGVKVLSSVDVDRLRCLTLRVSEVDTLHDLEEKVLITCGRKIGKIIIFLDISLDSLPELPRLTSPENFDMWLNGVHDAIAESVALAVAQLSLYYSQLRLDNSSLNPDGLAKFITTLKAKEVKVMFGLYVNAKRILY